MSERPRSALATWLAVAAITLPLAYVLSIGPIVWLGCYGNLNPALAELMELPYYPLAWLREHNETCGAALDWYIDLWR